MDDRPDMDQLRFDIETSSFDADASLEQQKETNLGVTSREIGTISVDGAARDREQEMEDAYIAQQGKENARNFRDLHRRMRPSAYRRSVPWRAK